MSSQTISYSMHVSISPTREEMGIAAGKCGERLLMQALEQKDVVRVIMGSAPSQNEVLGYLRTSRKIDWSRVEVFHMDEYIGITPDNPVSFSSYLDRTIIGHVPVKAFHRIVIPRDNPEESCRRYAEMLREKPIDVVFLGVGENGHIAFNDPIMADLKDPETVKIVELDDVCRMQQVHDGAFATLDDVPKTAVTVTVPALLSADHLVCTVPSGRKNMACRRLLLGSIDVECPATAMRLHSDCNLFLDSDSGAGIPEMTGVRTRL